MFTVSRYDFKLFSFTDKPQSHFSDSPKKVALHSVVAPYTVLILLYICLVIRVA